ncbi:MAG: dual specificity protein phosphatase family protein [Candidatus Uhrbacteria bacterium]|nr:dual specificity protein phosphatase family protein [Candidatus Uhrbacteria bacterium]
MKNKVVDLYNHLSGHKGFDYDQISDLIFLGTNMCCQFGFEKELLEKGVRADISLEKEKIDAPVGVDYFLWLPTEDGTPPSVDTIGLGVQTLEFFAQKKIKAYIHCKNGHGRAPTLLAAYYIKQGMSVEKAVSLIQSKRSAIHINEIQISALKNLII